MREQLCVYLEGEFPERGTTNAKALRQGCLAYVQYSKEPSLPGAKWGRERVLGNEIMVVAGAGSWGARETLVRTSALALCWLESH